MIRFRPAGSQSDMCQTTKIAPVSLQCLCAGGPKPFSGTTACNNWKSRLDKELFLLEILINLNLPTKHEISQ